MYLDLSDNIQRKKKKNIFEDIINKMKDFLQKYSNKLRDIESIVLFGSYALQNFDKESDIDLCIIFKEDKSRSKEKQIHGLILDLSKELKKNIDVLYIYPDQIEELDHTILDSILAQGILIYGNKKYKTLLLKYLQLKPFQAISFSLKHLEASEKMKFIRMLYGYETSVKNSNKHYNYERPGLLEKINGRKLGSGMILIPEKKIPIVERSLKKFNIKFASFRVWKQEI